MKYSQTAASSATMPHVDTSTPLLTIDAPPSTIDKEYWVGRGEVSCPRGCKNFVCRFTHYKRHHYEVYYELVYRPQWSALDRWMSVQFGDEHTGARVCVRCIGERRNKPLYQNRTELQRHIHQAHSNVHFELLHEHSQVVKTVAWEMLQNNLAAEARTSRRNAMQQETAAAAIAAAPIYLDAPACNEDRDYWTGKGDDPCPRGCINNFLLASRLDHYKRNHYNVFYALVNRPQWTALDRWMSVQFGDEHAGARVCVRCDGVIRNQPHYQLRVDLQTHIQSAHPAVFLELIRDHKQVVNDVCLRLLQNKLDDASAREKAQQDVAAAAADDAPLALDAPPSILDKGYWIGKEMANCPRGCAHYANRAGHYKRDHYNVYYALVTRPQWTALDRWMSVQFGDEHAGARVCVRCDREIRNKTHYHVRVDLLTHIQSAHPDEYFILVRDYSTKHEGSPITDPQVHLILMNCI